MVLQNPQEQADRLPPPHTLIVDFTLTHTHYGRSHVYSIGHLTNTRRSDGVPEPDGSLRVVSRKKILLYRQLYLDHPEPMVFIPSVVDTSGLIYDDFLRFLFLYSHRETSVLDHEIPKESGQFRFLHKVSVGLILSKTTDMRISIPFDLSSRPFIPLPCFVRSRRPTPLLAPSLVFSPLCPPS